MAAAPRRPAKRTRASPKSRATTTPTRPAAGAPRKPARGKPARRRITRALRERTARILWKLDEIHPRAACSLRHRTPFELLVATVLSAQCTDARVNIVTRELFRRARTPRKLAALPQEELEELIRSTGFFRNKARNLKAAAQAIVERHGGRVPDTMEELLALPGVARKTANCVLGTAWGKAEGIVVDTHVVRISRLLGLTKEKDPVKIERDLMELLPREHWIRFTFQLIDHGRSVCIARRPRCKACALAPDCPSARVSAPDGG